MPSPNDIFKSCIVLVLLLGYPQLSMAEEVPFPIGVECKFNVPDATTSWKWTAQNVDDLRKGIAQLVTARFSANEGKLRPWGFIKSRDGLRYKITIHVTKVIGGVINLKISVNDIEINGFPILKPTDSLIQGSEPTVEQLISAASLAIQNKLMDNQAANKLEAWLRVTVPVGIGGKWMNKDSVDTASLSLAIPSKLLNLLSVSEFRIAAIDGSNRLHALRASGIGRQMEVTIDPSKPKRIALLAFPTHHKFPYGRSGEPVAIDERNLNKVTKLNPRSIYLHHFSPPPPPDTDEIGVPPQPEERP